MTGLNKALIAAAMLVSSSTASADVCTFVNGTVKAAAAGLATQAALTSAPLTAVLHSSGGYILTGTSGYLANTLGSVAGAWAVATSAAVIAVTAGVVVTGVGVVATCHYLGD